MSLSRRSLLGGMAAVSAVSVEASRARPVLGAVGDFRTDPRAAVKVHADLDPHGSGPWWYDISIYAMRPSKAPLLLLKAEGCEHSFARSRRDGAYVLRNATVSSFKDAVTGRWLEEFDNPITGKRNRAKANVIEGGATIFGANGRDIFRDDSGMKSSQISSGAGRAGPPVRIGRFDWLESGDQLCQLKEGIAAGSYQPLMETSSTWVSRNALLDPTTTRVGAVFSSSFVSPWMPWLEMEQAEGHLLWHSAGRKLRALDDLPHAYRVRAEQIAPGLLASNPFDRS